MTEINRLENNSNENNVDNGNNGNNNTAAKIITILSIVFEFVVIHVKFIYYIFEHLFYMIYHKEEASVTNEIVLITGTAHGIGKEMALQYGNLGAIVVCLDINEKGNLETVSEIKKNGGKAHHYACNVLMRENIIEVANKIKKEVGSVNILVNNAGIMPCHELLKTTESEIRNMFDINVLAHFWLLQSFLPDMILKNRGHIVALSSCAGLFGLKYLVPYCSTKFAVRGLMHSLNEELRAGNKNCNIKLTTIYPYMVDTGLCKKPKMRFPNLMRLVKPKDAATLIIAAQRKGIEEITIPRFYLYLERAMKLVPKKAAIVLLDFLDIYVDTDL